MKRNKGTLCTPRREKGAINTSTESDTSAKDPVHVFCRIRPLPVNDETCIKLNSTTSLTISAPAESKIMRRDTSYIFKHIFTSYSSQKEVFDTIALPLLQDLIDGKNGLLFTYGITGSGKTYTLTGEPDNPGIMPRCINTLFNTIGESQAPKYVIKSDKMNGFEIQAEGDALEDRKFDLRNRGKLYRTPSKERIVYTNDEKKLNDFNEANIYSVFISYIEIYNNIVYDLLEESSGKTLQSKILREDAQKSMYVNGVVEMEVKSALDAFELFNLGQKRKKMAHTMLNSESSRSHSVFTIRVVQLVASRNSQGDVIIPEENLIKISQLSLVDLAGSERCSRTQTTGVRLKEASSINNSLMSLRTCMEILRENQLSRGNRLVPYRDSRLTHLFKNYFEGEGQIKMIICLNPTSQDYEENLHVMKFGEMSQDVKVNRAEGRYTPYCIKKRGHTAPTPTKTTVIKKPKIVPSVLGPKLPSVKLDFDDYEECGNIIKALHKALQMRYDKKGEERFSTKSFRKRLIETDQENVIIKSEANSMKAILKKEKHKNINYQTKIVDLENNNASLSIKNEELQSVVNTLKQTIDEKNLKINQNLLEREKTKQKFVKQQEKLNQELDDQLRRQRQHLQAKMKTKEQKLINVRKILDAEGVCQEIPDTEAQTQTDTIVSEPQTPIRTNNTPYNCRRNAVTSIKRRRSRSVGDVWLEHNSIKPVALGTVLQPTMKKRKSVTKLTKASDVTHPSQSKYCLIAQEPDVDGEVETKLYKADIVPTCGGGAQVIFNDVEKLTQESPCSSPRK